MQIIEEKKTFLFIETRDFECGKQIIIITLIGFQPFFSLPEND